MFLIKKDIEARASRTNPVQVRIVDCNVLVLTLEEGKIFECRKITCQESMRMSNKTKRKLFLEMVLAISLVADLCNDEQGAKPVEAFVLGSPGPDKTKAGSQKLKKRPLGSVETIPFRGVPSKFDHLSYWHILYIGRKICYL